MKKIQTALSSLVMAIIVWAGFNLNHEALAQEGNVPRYVDRQTFVGHVFDKDNNVWVYNQKFADLFGMPPENIQELKGIEAAAFRIQLLGYSSCGYGGKEENCMSEKRCVTDVYIDESKNPLPWASDNQADWLAQYNSLRWVKVTGDVPITPTVPNGVIANTVILGAATLHPFADAETREEVNVFASYSSPQSHDMSFSFIPIFGYKRDAVAHLTMLTLSYRCLSRNSTKKDITFRLESRKEIYSPVIKRFYEFTLPDFFEKRIDENSKNWHERDTQFYKSVLGLK